LKADTLQKATLALAALVISITLAGCSIPSSVTLACDASGGGEQVDSIEVSSEKLKKPTVSFVNPISADSIQSRVVFEGEGNVFTGRNLIEFEFAGYNGGNGQLLQETAFDGQNPAPGFFGPDSIPNFCSALVGAKEGSRVVAIFPPKDAHDGRGVESLGVGPNDSFVFIFDLSRVYLEKAEGSAVAPEAGMPAVVTTPEGIPGVTIPKTDAPAELRIAQLVKGSGDTVESGDNVTMHYSGFLWANGTKFDSSWDRGTPAQFQVVEGQLIEGFLSAVVGQPVGTRVVVVIPPSLGYGDQGSATIPANSTLVFVIDILGTSSK
jgi:FKBP-type peptidyl-prolyl cis-trans isomerase